MNAVGDLRKMRLVDGIDGERREKGRIARHDDPSPPPGSGRSAATIGARRKMEINRRRGKIYDDHTT
jgi:hypothetical protein